MIKLLVDESYAFDYLSILNIKHDMDRENKQKKENYFKCLNFLKAQFSDKSFFQSILDSKEFQNCYRANLLTFKAVDKAKKNKISASYVDKCNYKRYLVKEILQKKFFNNNLTETKIGYEIYNKKDI